MRWILRWIFIRNAVKYFLHPIHRNHRISYKIDRIYRISFKNSPKNLDTGNTQNLTMLQK